MREARQAEKEQRSSNEKGSRMIAERLEFQTFNNKQRQEQSSRHAMLHAAFIDLKQAYDAIPTREALWEYSSSPEYLHTSLLAGHP
eukprot:532421-Pelagomonas_calceolata.AAC.1